MTVCSEVTPANQRDDPQQRHQYRRWVFSGCTSLTRITVDTANPKYSSLDGVLFNKALNTLILCPYGRSGTYMIPDSVINIGDGAFGDCTRLTSVAIPSSVTNIDEQVFSGCTSLTHITVDTTNPKYSSLDGVLFNKEQTSLILCPYGRSGTYMIPDSVTNMVLRRSPNAPTDQRDDPDSVIIGDFAFYECARLTSVTILTASPASVISHSLSAPPGHDDHNSVTNIEFRLLRLHLPGQ